MFYDYFPDELINPVRPAISPHTLHFVLAPQCGPIFHFEKTKQVIENVVTVSFHNMSTNNLFKAMSDKIS